MNGREDEAAEHGQVTEILDPENSLALSAITRAEIDTQIATAKRYPRSIVAFKRQALEMATLDEETAGSMFYTLPRDGKRIEGPSVRLAEIVGSAWGNIRYGARVIEVGDKFLKAQGATFDLEKNVACTVEVTRRIVGKSGKRYSDDMITVTSNAACSIALRQAIFKVVPFAFVKDIYEQAKQASLGKALTMEQRRTRAFEWFAKIGAKPDQVLKLLGRKGIEDITVDDLVALQGIRTALQDGETTLDQVLREAEGEPVVARPEGLTTEKLLAGQATGENNAPPKLAEPAKAAGPKSPAPAQSSLADF